MKFKSILLALVLLTGMTHAALIIYEPFADTNATLTGNASGTGLTGNWTSNNFTVAGSSLSYGSQPTSGGSARYVNTSASNGNITATVSTLTGAGTEGSLANAGLLTDGAVLWFSVMHKVVNNMSDDRASFALATGGFSSNTNFGVSTDQGIGFAISNTGNLTARVSTASATHVNGANINRFSLAETVLIVGKITWGATDTVELYLPDTNMNLGSASSTASAAIDQSAFDVIALFSRQQSDGTLATQKTDMSYDEIRFGSTLASVMVPEPRAALLGAFGVLLLLRRRRQ